MRIVALLSNELLAHFVATVGDVHPVHATNNFVELRRLLFSTGAELLVVDPIACTGVGSDAIEATIACHSQLPVVAYTMVTPIAIGTVLRLARVGVQHVVLHGVDDDRDSLMTLIEGMPDHWVAELMLRELASSLLPLPRGLRQVLERVIRSPGSARRASELAVMAGMTRRSLNRHMMLAGLQPRHLITCARLVRAYTLLRTPGARLKEISAKLGYADSQTLNEHFFSWTGHTGMDVRGALPPEQFVRLLTERLQHAGTHRPTSVEAC